MKKNAGLLFILILSLSAHSQKSKGAQTKKGYTITKVAPYTGLVSDETRIIFTFVGPDGKPAKSHLKIVCNSDSAFPVIDALGNYTAELDPGKYKMRFSVPFWNEVKTDSILCKKKMATSITIKFEAQDIKAGTKINN
jgi:hypothetical protein